MMVELDVIDPKVAKASAALARGGDDALSEHREVCGKAAYDAVAKIEPGPIHAAQKAGLLRWIHELTQARIGSDLAREEKEREKAVDPALEGAIGEITIAKTWDEGHRALIHAPNDHEIEKALARLEEIADPITAVRRERRLRRFEVSRRLGLPHPWALAVDGGAATIDELARAVLDATEPLAVDLHKRLGRTPAHSIEAAFAREAREGWPARLQTRWLEEAFHTIAPRTPNDVRLPEAIGGASFLRAAADWGYALRIGSTARSLPFSLARDPAPTEAFLYGDLLAIAVSRRVFGKRKLDMAARVAEAQERVLARSLFFHVRSLAALARLGGDESAASDEIEHVAARLFGTPLPLALGPAWANGGFSGAIRNDVPARLVAAVRAFALHAELVNHYDEDWFDNPRAGQRLANVTGGPIWQGDKPAPETTKAITRSFEEAIG